MAKTFSAYKYVGDVANYALLLEDDLAVLGGLDPVTAGDDLPAKPIKFKPRHFNIEATDGSNSKKRIICNANNEAYMNVASTTVTYNSVIYRSTGTRGEQRTFIKLKPASPPSSP